MVEIKAVSPNRSMDNSRKQYMKTSSVFFNNNPNNPISPHGQTAVKVRLDIVHDGLRDYIHKISLSLPVFGKVSTLC
ncbi:hypothetical protein CEXT_71421 [Caerostris extrusa]|uniref:Uncharacterized protein n=1 Tax=Caerostris extrusa TaxID=172846 RepID=A0AAV4XI84_CAEEX|nr:hypothetical protein CEXT_71421 [Caerostris extrusa]